MKISPPVKRWSCFVVSATAAVGVVVVFVDLYGPHKLRLSVLICAVVFTRINLVKCVRTPFSPGLASTCKYHTQCMYVKMSASVSAEIGYDQLQAHLLLVSFGQEVLEHKSTVRA